MGFMQKPAAANSGLSEIAISADDQLYLTEYSLKSQGRPGLVDEMRRYGDAVAQRHLDALMAAGVRGRALADAGADSWFAPIGAAVGTTTGPIWAPCETGRELLVMPVMTHGALLDLVAWSADLPAKFWLRRGHAEVLGFDEIERAEFFGEPLRIFASPLSWLRTGGGGAVILDWQCGPLWLTGCTRIIAENRDLAAKLDRAINRRPLVQIKVAA